MIMKDFDLEITPEQKAKGQAVKTAFLKECGIDEKDYDENSLEWGVKAALSAGSIRILGFCLFKDDPTTTIEEATYLLAEYQELYA